MEIRLINSESNPVIKHTKSLKLKKQRIKNRQYLIEGIRIVDQCLSNKGPIEYIIYSENLHNVQGGTQLLNKVSQNNYNIYEVPNQLFNKIAITESPQGILAVVNMETHTLEGLNVNKDSLFFVILDRIQDPGNMGTIIRTCESARVDAVIVTRGCVDIYSDKTIRATMGAMFHLPIIECDNNQWVSYLKQNNVKLIGADLGTEKTYVDINYNENIGIIIGNEANGISKELLSQADEVVKIPILGKIESLNAGVAASILIYKAVEEKYLKVF